MALVIVCHHSELIKVKKNNIRNEYIVYETLYFYKQVIIYL